MTHRKTSPRSSFADGSLCAACCVAAAPAASRMPATRTAHTNTRAGVSSFAITSPPAPAAPPLLLLDSTLASITSCCAASSLSPTPDSSRRAASAAAWCGSSRRYEGSNASASADATDTEPSARGSWEMAAPQRKGGGRVEQECVHDVWVGRWRLFVCVVCWWGGECVHDGWVGRWRLCVCGVLVGGGGGQNMMQAGPSVRGGRSVAREAAVATGKKRGCSVMPPCQPRPSAAPPHCAHRACTSAPHPDAAHAAPPRPAEGLAAVHRLAAPQPVGIKPSRGRLRQTADRLRCPRAGWVAPGCWGRAQVLCAALLPCEQWEAQRALLAWLPHWLRPCQKLTCRACRWTGRLDTVVAGEWKVEGRGRWGASAAVDVALRKWTNQASLCSWLNPPWQVKLPAGCPCPCPFQMMPYPACPCPQHGCCCCQRLGRGQVKLPAGCPCPCPF
eukprot:365831-Chlamydomonas_euryale.AAC.10